jgi:hypothetical protein
MNGKDKNNVLGIKSKYAEMFESMKVQLKRINNIEKTVNIKINYGTQNDITIYIHTYAYNFNR